MTFQDQLVAAFAAFDVELNDSTVPVARERELVSFFAFGALLEVLSPTAPLRTARQIGIEVAVPQRPSPAKGKRRKKSVCKDLVVWGSPDASTWGRGEDERRFPLAVIEWKAETASTSRTAALAAAARDSRELALWLKARGNRSQAYSVVITGRSGPRKIRLTRVTPSGATVVFESAGWWRSPGLEARRAP